MNIISEQVKELRELAEDCKCENDKDDIVRVLQVAADIIEELSAKLATTNMERSNAYYGCGWIACSERLPEKNGTFLIQTQNNNIYTAFYGYNTTCTYRAFWSGYMKVENVLAWQPLPKPYQVK